ncbi:MAG: hypothetical protein HY330_04135 [Chloroflexi bacterium]|nr:hypothetical protein [Chloroflexota bacterium]
MATLASDNNKGAYIQAASESLRREFERVQEEVYASQRRSAELAKGITEEARRVRAGRKRLEAIQRWLEEAEQQHADEFDALLRHPTVDKVECDPKAVTVYTKPIRIEWDDLPYKIGDFKIRLGWNGEVDLENFHNYGESVVYDHPHITRGQPCLGNVQEGVAKLVGEFQFAAAVDVIVNFLQTYDPKEAWKKIENWPIDLEYLEAGAKEELAAEQQRAENTYRDQRAR